MYQKFFENTLISKFIKNMLQETYIPTIPFLQESETIIENHSYIWKKFLVVAKDTFNPRTSEDNIEDHLIFKKRYFFGDFIPGCCTKFISKTAYYDPETHYYLRKYLEAIKSYFEIDLSSLCNCFSDTYFINGSIELIDNKWQYSSKKNSDVRILAIPIEYNHKYSIFLDSSNTVVLTPIIFDSFSIIDDFLSKGNYSKIVNFSSFKRPFIYKAPTTEEIVNLTRSQGQEEKASKLLSKERYLYLLIQTSTLDSSVVVLDGDYTSNAPSYGKKIIKSFDLLCGDDAICSDDTICGAINENIIDVAPIVNLNSKAISPSLGLLPTDKTAAFSNRLIEYLTYNVITPVDNISDNIARVQYYVTSPENLAYNGKNYKADYDEGIWNDELTEYLFDLSAPKRWELIEGEAGHIETEPSKYILNNLDILGYVDKDVETMISVGQEG